MLSITVRDMDRLEIAHLKLALSVLSQAILRLEYSKDCRHVEELEAIAEGDLIQLANITREKNG